MCIRDSVHIVNPLGRNLHKFILISCNDLFIYKSSVLIKGFVCLCNIKSLLKVGGHIGNLVGYSLIFLVNTSVRRFDTAVFINPGKAAQGVDKSDVRTLRGLDGAHAAVVRMVNVCLLYTSQHCKRRSPYFSYDFTVFI